MITFQPAFRMTEEFYLGPVTVHYEDGVVGYVVDQIDYATLLSRSIDNGDHLVWQAQADVVRWADQQGRTLTRDQVDSLDREHGMHRTLTRDDADALALALGLWQRDRRDAFLAEYDEEQRRIAAGTLAYD